MHDQSLGRITGAQTARDGLSCLIYRRTRYLLQGCLSLMMYSYVVSKTLNLPPAELGGRSTSAAGSPVRREDGDAQPLAALGPW